MAVFTIGDLHLSLGGNHSMEVFPGWEDYVNRIEAGWRACVGENDTVVLAGDFSWGMSLEQALPDFLFLESLPGKKHLLKGNHDYWWSTKKKVGDFFCANGLSTIELLHNNSVVSHGVALCGSRGWIFETGEPADDKIINREAIRLELSLSEGAKTGLETVAFLHYPPVYGESTAPAILEALHKYNVRRCYYGHVHGASSRWAIKGPYENIQFYLVSADYLGFNPIRVTTPE